MREKYIPAIIMLIAGTAASIINIINKVELITGLKRLLFVLVLFYIIGLIAKAIIVKTMNAIPKETQEEIIQDNEEIQQQENTNSSEGNNKN